MTSDILIEERAMRAYFRRFGPDAVIPSTGRTEAFEKEGKKYVQLANVNGNLVTYRVVPSRDGGFRLKYVE